MHKIIELDITKGYALGHNIYKNLPKRIIFNCMQKANAKLLTVSKNPMLRKLMVGNKIIGTVNGRIINKL